MTSDTRHGCPVGRAAALTAVVCVILLGAVEAFPGESAVTPHEEFIAEYRRLGSLGKAEEREKLSASFLAEAEAYITQHPKGPEIVQAKLNRALALGLYGPGDDAEADALFSEIRSAYPESELMPEVMLNHASLLMFTFEPQHVREARAILLQLVKQFPASPKAPTALRLAAQITWWDVKDTEEAMLLFKRLLKDYPGSDAEMEARANLISLLADSGDAAATRAHIDAFLERFANARELARPEAWQWYLTDPVPEACRCIDDQQRLMKVLSAAMKAYPDTDGGLRARAHLIDLAISKGDEASALEQIDEFIERHKTPPEGVPPNAWADVLCHAVGDACVRLKAWGRAEACHKTVLEAYPEGEIARQALLSLAQVYATGFDGKRVDEQAATLLKVVQQNPRAPEAPRALLEAAHCHEWRLKDKTTAERLYKRVVAEYPDTTEAFQATGRLIAMPLHAGNTAGAEQLLRAFDKTIAELSDPRRAAQANLVVTRELYTCLWNYPSRTELRERVLGRFRSLAEEHPGTEEAAEALFELALHYATTEYFDAENSETYALRFLDEDRNANAERYAKLVRRIMQDDLLLLQAARAELPGRARALIRRFPLATARERRQFLLDVEGSYGAEGVDRMLAKVIAFAQKRSDGSLLKEALLFRAECFFSKEWPDQALSCLGSLTEAKLTVSAEEERRIRECRACCHVLLRQYGRAASLFEELADRAPDAESNAEGTSRTKAYYDYWRAAAAFGQGQYAVSKQQFDALVSQYPGDRWAERATLYIRHIEPLLETGSDAQAVEH